MCCCCCVQTLNQQKNREDEAIILLHRLCAHIHMKSSCDHSTSSKGTASSSSLSHCSCSNPEKQLLVMVSSPLVQRISSYLSNDSGSSHSLVIHKSLFTFLKYKSIDTLNWIESSASSDGHFTPRPPLQGSFGAVAIHCQMPSPRPSSRHGSILLYHHHQHTEWREEEWKQQELVFVIK